MPLVYMQGACSHLLPELTPLLDVPKLVRATSTALLEERDKIQVAASDLIKEVAL